MALLTLTPNLLAASTAGLIRPLGLPAQAPFQRQDLSHLSDQEFRAVVQSEVQSHGPFASRLWGVDWQVDLLARDVELHQLPDPSTPSTPAEARLSLGLEQFFQSDGSNENLGILAAGAKSNAATKEVVDIDLFKTSSRRKAQALTEKLEQRIFLSVREPGARR